MAGDSRNISPVPLPHAMQHAGEAFNQGDWARAEQLCRSILEAQPTHLDALTLLGIIAARTLRTGEAAALLGRAAAANPEDASVHNNYGNVLKELNRFEDALDSYERALKIKPDYAEAYINRGVTLHELGRLEEALDSYERALKITPDFSKAYNTRGVTLHELRHFEEALASFERALQIQPDYAEAYNNRGNTLHKLTRFADALTSYERAVKIRPDYAKAYFNRGVTLHELERFAEALLSYEQALRITPDDARAYFNSGITLHTLKRFEEALTSYERALSLTPDFAEAFFKRGVTLQELERFEDALASYERTLQITPDHADAHFNRGVILQTLKRFEDAVATYECVLNINPDSAEAYNNRGAALQELKRFGDALDSYERALQLKPKWPAVLSNRGAALQQLKRAEEAADSYAIALEIDPDWAWLYGTWLSAKMRLCDWNDFGSQIRTLIAKVQQAKKTTPPSVLALTDSLVAHRQAAETWVNEKYPATRLTPSIKRSRRGKLRVGYYSADFHEHATTHLMAELFERHDRERFEVTAFSYGPDKADDMRKRLSAAFDRFVDVRTKSDGEVAGLSRELEIDIGVDLKGFTQDARTGIFSRRAAPIQVNYLGYPGTMGAQYMDYIVADHTLIPPVSQQHYAEKIVYLPHSYQVNDRRRQIANEDLAREKLGLPATGFVFCCFNNNYKITPSTFDGWMRILKQVDGSVLWLLEDNKTAADNLRKEAEVRDVDAERLVFAQRMALPEHLARHRAADLFLDTLPCNAHTTASDALWAGLPLLTCIGESFAARVAASVLTAVGLPDLITTTQEQYEAVAIELATNPGRLAQIRERLHRNRLTMPLFDAEMFTKHLENAYTQMHERYQADLNPEHIYVPP